MQGWIIAVVIAILAGQADSSLKRPDGWKVRLDRPGFFSSEPDFVAMAPGWQIITGPSIIAYETAASARGTFRLESEILLFPGAQNEGYGLFLGGNALDSNDLSYTAFQLRRDGKFSIWFRKASTTRDIVPWTSHPAIVSSKAGMEPAKNLLAIEVRPAEVAFLINGRVAYLGRRSELEVAGNFGFRVHENLNIHPTKLTLQVVP